MVVTRVLHSDNLRGTPGGKVFDSQPTFPFPIFCKTLSVWAGHCMCPLTPSRQPVKGDYPHAQSSLKSGRGQLDQNNKAAISSFFIFASLAESAEPHFSFCSFVNPSTFQSCSCSQGSYGLVLQYLNVVFIGG